jgi:hypothetical protein
MNLGMRFTLEGSVSINEGNVYEMDPGWIRIRGSADPSPRVDGSSNIGFSITNPSKFT